MKIRFVRTPDGGRKHEFNVGDELEFTGLVQEGYARKYIDRGWAEEVIPAAVVEAVAEPVFVERRPVGRPRLDRA